MATIIDVRALGRRPRHVWYGRTRQRLVHHICARTLPHRLSTPRPPLAQRLSTSCLRTKARAQDHRSNNGSTGTRGRMVFPRPEGGPRVAVQRTQRSWHRSGMGHLPVPWLTDMLEDTAHHRIIGRVGRRVGDWNRLAGGIALRTCRWRCW